MPIRGMNGDGDNALVFESQREDGVEFAQECKRLAVLVAVADQATIRLPAACEESFSSTGPVPGC